MSARRLTLDAHAETCEDLLLAADRLLPLRKIVS
jgi:hypothetical protein